MNRPDKIEEFEQSMPFNRIKVDTFMRLLDQIEVEGDVTLESLSEKFNT